MTTVRCFLVSDLHGRVERYRALLQRVEAERPDAVLVAGDLLPALGGLGQEDDFLTSFLEPELAALAGRLGAARPRWLVIPGNDDPRSAEARLIKGEDRDLWELLHMRRTELGGHPLFGYACVPPTPFMLKDWERYDVSRYVDPGCVSPEEGWRTVEVDADDARYGTIRSDLEELTRGETLDEAILLLHSPPYDTSLDRAALDGAVSDGVPLDVHVGSIAIRRLLEERQPLLSLHGHVHESARLTGAWRTRIGRTHCLSAAHDGPELALVRFALDDLGAATRELV